MLIDDLVKRRILILVFLGIFLVEPFSFVQAQQPPDRRFLFLEDREEKVNEERRKRYFREKQRKVRAQQKSNRLPFDIDAQSIDFDSEGQKIQARGNVSLSYSSALVEADEGNFDISKEEADLRGDVRISDVAGDLSAREGRINFKSGEAELLDAEVDFSQGQYRVSAGRVRRSAEDRYQFEDADLTTCNCPDAESCVPWRISAERAEVTKDGYGKVWNSTLDIFEYPVLYMPYLIFPAKTSRQTGLLPARVGVGRESEFQLELPFFLAIDRSTDWTITPFIQTATRVGVKNEVRKVFSERHDLSLGLLYSDEEKRGEDLFGTDVSGIFDSTIDKGRIAGWLDHRASFSIGSQDFRYITDGRYVSDDLILRELDLPQIGESSDRFVTSTMLLRTAVFDTYAIDLSGEYNQAMVVDDDLVFQRIPELSVGGFSTFRPFGENRFGMKGVLSSQFYGTVFQRKKDYEGQRFDLHESLKFPFHYKSYFDASIDLDVRASQYSLDRSPEFAVAELGEELSEEQEEENRIKEQMEDNSSRIVPGIGGSISTVVEKVMDVEEDSLVKRIAELGRIGRTEELSRVKHSIQPILKYRYVPDIDQSDTPIFDSLDRLEQKNVVSWQVVQRLSARFEPRDDLLYGYDVIAPEVGDLEGLRSEGPVDPSLTFGANVRSENAYQRIRRGTKTELAALSIGQSYDIDEEINDRTNEDAFSDLNIDLILAPNGHVRFRGRSNYDTENNEFSSYSFQTQLIDKRGDQLRAELRFVEDQVRQLEAGFQILLSDNLKLGYYGRYDDLNSEFLENKLGLRMSSKCNCWIVDVDVLDRINPNNTSLSFTFTLIGIGEFGSRFFSLNNAEDDL